MSCANCSGSSCGCRTVSGRRGPRGLIGLTGADGENAQVSFGDGPPTTPPDPVTAAGIYYDQATDGHVWEWDGVTSGPWTDVGPWQGTSGVDGLNAYTSIAAATTIPAAGGFMLITVPSGENAWIVPGQIIFIQTAGYFQVLNLVGTTQAALINPRNDTTGAYQSNAVSGPLVVGSFVSPGGIQGPVGLPVEFTSGAPDPTVAPAGGASGFYVQTGTGGTYWYYNGASGGPWTDTLQSVTGPQGDDGDPGTNGYSPVTTTGTTVPSGGTNGDIYFRQVNAGLLQVYTRPSGVWVAGITLLANRLLGYSNSNPTPNPSSLPQNAGDQWWTQIGATVTLWVYNGSSWAVAVTFTTGGGGGGSDLPTTIAATTGQLSGNLPVNWQRINFNVVNVATTSSPGGTITFDTNYAYHDLTIDGSDNPTTLNYIDPPAGYYSEWVFMVTNSLSGGTAQADITFAAGQWRFPDGVPMPEILNNGESMILHCYFYKSIMWVSAVDMNGTIS